MNSGRILIVDDEESVALTMQAVLEMDGHDVIAVNRVGEALELIRAREFDLVLTDLRLDDGDGLSILAEVRRVSPETITIMLTGFASLESAVQALREGAFDYLIKPCDVEELRARIGRGLERRQLGAELAHRVRELETANETIRGLNADLQRRVDEATAELRARMADLARANDEIEALYRDSQSHVAQLRQLDELKSRFLSMASHELKTPLTAISGFSQIVLRRVQRRMEMGRPSDEEWEQETRANLERLEMLRSQIGKLVRLVDELLDVSRIESGRVEFQFSEIDVARLATAVAEHMQLTTSDHEIRVRQQMNEATTVVADQDHIEQVLNNLLSNAIKYSPEGGAIDVGIEAQTDNVLISVHDNGQGVPEGQEEAVFGLFYRAPESGPRKTEGLGLGLYISREIVARHGGRIWVESKGEGGSTFYVELPRVPVAQPVATS